jgi:geranylgeranyl diphosphate synthase type II
VTILEALGPWRATVDDGLRAYLASHTDGSGEAMPAVLREAIAHALLAPGKRLRPLVCLAVADALAEPRTGAGTAPGATPAGAPAGAASTAALPAALALELVHTYSLVHDDLPALDDDTLRRGRPTLHVAFDEATAILAGDALLTDAFALLAGAPVDAAAQVRELALAAGSTGMVAGQLHDMAAEGKPTTVEALRAIHGKKTGRLFAAAAALGALAVGRADKRDAAYAWGQALGFAFQVQDDVLDVEGDVDAGGKARGRDLKHEKATYVRLLGVEGARALAQHATADALAACEALVPAQPLLRALTRFAGERRF